MADKVCFLGQIFEVKILVDLHVLRSIESEIKIFNGCFERLSLPVCVCTVIHIIQL